MIQQSPTAPATPPRRRPWYAQLYVQVLAAILFGALLGWLAPGTGVALKPLGDAFIALVRMVIAPVIFLTLVTGIASLSDLGALGRVMLKAFGYFLLLSTFALILGLVVAHVVHPGTGLHVRLASLDQAAIQGYVQTAQEHGIGGFLLHIIPGTLLSPLAGGDILQTLLVSVLFGIAASLVGEPARPVIRMLEQLSAIVFRLVGILMWAAPIGAFGAISFTIGRFGVGALLNLAALLATFYVTALLFVLVVLGAVCRLCGFSILRLLRYLRDEMLLVLGTSSSEAALPGLIAKMEAAGCDRSVVGVVVPTGYSFNLDGTNIYMTLAALFIAQACDVPLSLGQQALLLGVAMLSSKGAAGVTGAGFITLAATLSVVPAVPVAGMALILGIDRFMSGCRSLTNFIGNAVATVVVARWEGGLDASRFRAALAAPGTVPTSIGEIS